MRIEYFIAYLTITVYHNDSLQGFPVSLVPDRMRHKECNLNRATAGRETFKLLTQLWVERKEF